MFLRWWLCHHPTLAQRSRDFDDASAPKTGIVQNTRLQTILLTALPSLAETGLLAAALGHGLRLQHEERSLLCSAQHLCKSV